MAQGIEEAEEVRMDGNLFESGQGCFSKNVQEELVEDMMSLIACFSGRLYGMRSRKAKKKEGAANEKDKQS